LDDVRRDSATFTSSPCVLSFQVDSVILVGTDTVTVTADDHGRRTVSSDYSSKLVCMWAKLADFIDGLFFHGALLKCHIEGKNIHLWLATSYPDHGHLKTEEILDMFVLAISLFLGKPQHTPRWDLSTTITYPRGTGHPLNQTGVTLAGWMNEICT